MKTPHSSATAGGQGVLNRVLAWACLLLAVVLPVAVLAMLWHSTPADMLAQLDIQQRPGSRVGTVPLSTWQHGLVVGLGMLPVSAMAYALWRAHQCFRGFARGDVFSLATVRHLRGFAAGLLVASCAGMVVPVACAWLLTLGVPAGSRGLSISVGSQQLLLLLFSGIVWQMGQAMTRAVELADDNAQII